MSVSLRSAPRDELGELTRLGRPGSGSGYLVAVMHHLVGTEGFVLGIDHIPQLVSNSLAALKGSPSTAAALSSSPPSIKVVVGDGRAGAKKEDLPEQGWDAIHVGAAAPEIPPALVNQLRAPGRMFIPVGVGSQVSYLGECCGPIADFGATTSTGDLAGRQVGRWQGQHEEADGGQLRPVSLASEIVSRPSADVRRSPSRKFDRF